MMKFFKKGQAALEFLTTYGWAFLVILVMIGALGYFGVFDTGRFVPESCKLDSKLECPVVSIAPSNDQVQFEIQNNLQDPISITAIELVERNDPNINFSATLSTSVDIEETSSADITWSPATVGVSYDDAAIQAEEGEKLVMDVNIFYTVDGGSIQQISTGSVTATIQ